MTNQAHVHAIAVLGEQQLRWLDDEQRHQEREEDDHELGHTESSDRHGAHGRDAT